MKSRIFQKIFAYDLACYDLMSDVFGSYKKQCRKNGKDCFQIKFRCLKIRKCKKCSFFYCSEIKNATCSCGNITCDDCDQDRNNGQETAEEDLAEYSNSQCDQKYNHIFHINTFVQKTGCAGSASGKFQTDQCNNRSHSCGRKNNVDPVRSTLTDDQRNDHSTDTENHKTAQRILKTEF